MKVKKGFVLRDVCGEHIIVAEGRENIDFNNIISMNDTAAFVWSKILEKEFTVDDMTDCVTEEYDIDRDTALKDCTALASQWIEAGIVE